MKLWRRIFACITSAVVALTCSGTIGLVSASAAAKITDVKIIRFPNKIEYVYGSDWKYGHYSYPENGGNASFVEDTTKKQITFTYNGGLIMSQGDRGWLDLNGLVVRVKYSDGKTKDISYSETKDGNKVFRNVEATPVVEYKLGENKFEVYFKSNIYVYDSFYINVVEKATQLGDVNADGKVNSSDALIVLQHVVGIKYVNSIKFDRGDMNKDRTLNSYDALQILRKAVS